MARPAHAYWQHQFLHVAQLPATSQNVYFLTQWALYSSANSCAHNPIDLSHDEPGSSRCRRIPSGHYAKRYTDTASAANAFRDQLNLSDYPDLTLALASGDPFHFDKPNAVGLDLQRWGSIGWQQEYERIMGGHVSPPPTHAPPASKDAGRAWTHLMRTIARDGHRTSVELQRATASLNRIERRLRRA